MKIYVGNLPRELTEDDLRREFEAFGKVESVAIVKDRYSGQPRGFGFVEMPTKSEAVAALAGLKLPSSDPGPTAAFTAFARDLLTGTPRDALRQPVGPVVRTAAMAVCPPPPPAARALCWLVFAEARSPLTFSF